MSNELDEAERCWKTALELEMAGGRDASRAVIPLLIRADLFTCRALKTLLRSSPPAQPQPQPPPGDTENRALLREARTVVHYANNVLLYWHECAHDSGDGLGCAVCGNDPDKHAEDEPCGELQRALVDFEKAYGRTTPALADGLAGGLGDRQPQPACPSRSAFGDACELPRGHDLHRAGKVAWTTVEDDEPPEPPRQVMTGAPGDEELQRIYGDGYGRAPGDNRIVATCYGMRALYEAGLAHARAESEGMRRVVEACVDWQADTGGCHFCGFDANKSNMVDQLFHAADCPLVENGFIDRAGASLRPDRKPES